MQAEETVIKPHVFGNLKELASQEIVDLAYLGLVTRLGVGTHAREAFDEVA